MTEAKAAGYITAAEVMQMSPIQRAQLKHAHIGGWQDKWSQQKISQMFAPAAEQNTPTRARLTRPAQMVTMPHKTQRTISSVGSLGPEAEDPTYKKKKAGNKKKIDNSQLTLQESWNLPEASKAKIRVPNCVGKKRKAERNTSPHKRRRGNRKNTCHKCKLRGALIECHTCLNSCHIQCTETMPDNVKDPKVVWRCEDCHEKKGPTNCSFSKWMEGLKHTTAMVDTTVWSTQHQAVGREVQKRFGQQVYQGRITKWLPGSKDEWELWKIVYEDEDTEDVDTHELVRMLKVPATQTEQKPAGVDIMQAATKEEGVNETLEDRTVEQKKEKTLQTRKPNTDGGQRTRKNVDHTKRNRKKKAKTGGQMQDHDTMPNGQIAGRIHATNTELVKFLADIRGVTNGTLEDGHCLRRALGKLWGMQPGQVIRKIREGGEHFRLHRGKLRIESDDSWYKSICDRPSEWDNIQHNKNSHCSREEWGGDNELAIWAYIAQTTIIVTHKTLNTYTIHTPDVHTMPEMKPVSTLSSTHRQITCIHSEPVYLIYDGYHYNPVIHARSVPIRPVHDMPQWTPPPPSQKRARDKPGAAAASAGETESPNMHTEREQVMNNTRKKTKLGDSAAERIQQKRKVETHEDELDEQEYKSSRHKADKTGEDPNLT